MFWVVAGAIGLVVFVMSRPRGDVQKGQTLGPDTTIPATGTDAVQSPATTGGGNTAGATRGKLILGMTTGLPASVRQPATKIFVAPQVDNTSIDLEKALTTQSGVPLPYKSGMKVGPKM